MVPLEAHWRSQGPPLKAQWSLRCSCLEPALCFASCSSALSTNAKQRLHVCAFSHNVCVVRSIEHKLLPVSSPVQLVLTLAHHGVSLRAQLQTPT
eukprot:4599370-Amphidinium_carterae.1